jgi:hypothetical protein
LESFGLGAQGLTAQAREIASDASAMGQLFAAPVIAVVPVVILCALIEKHLVGGLTVGSVKWGRCPDIVSVGGGWPVCRPSPLSSSVAWARWGWA